MPVGHTGYLKAIRGDQFAIDPDKVDADERFDGLTVLHTNADLNPRDAMLCYEQLWSTEQAHSGLPGTSFRCGRSSTSGMRQPRAGSSHWYRPRSQSMIFGHEARRPSIAM
jgi:hypothetical protein